MTLRRFGLLVSLFLVAWIVLILCHYLVVGVYGSVLEGSDEAWSWHKLGKFLHGLATDGEARPLLVGSLLYSFGLVALIAPRVPALQRGSQHSLRMSVLGACILGGLLAFVGLMAVVDAAWLLAAPPGEHGSLGNLLLEPPTLFGGWLVSGAVWAWFLRRLGRRRDPQAVESLFRRVLAATGLELALSVPLHLMLRRRESCTCEQAAFLGLVLGAATLLWLCGPWALLFLGHRARKGWRRRIA